MLAAHGLRPRRGRGQNFLVDGNLVDAIVKDAGVGPGDSVLEVGTGTGILTDVLADRVGSADRIGRLVTCDIDARLQAIARAQRTWPDHVTFLPEDVLAGKQALNPAVLAAWKGEPNRRRVIANLPYSIATPFLANILAEEFQDAWILVQREVADRFVARPQTPQYGIISVLVSLSGVARIVRPVGPQVFWPQPRVQSAVVHLQRSGPLPDHPGLVQLLRRGFTWRRKTLRHAFAPARLEAAGIDPGARPQEVAPDEWARLLTVPPS